LRVPHERLIGMARFDGLLERFDADVAAMRERTIAALPVE
jgi:hypothetical protein